MAHEIGQRRGIRRSYQQGQVNDYKFMPPEIKLPILNSILRSDWDVRCGIWWGATEYATIAPALTDRGNVRAWEACKLMGKDR